MFPRRLVKQLTCPQCGDVIGEAAYRAWPGRLVVTSVQGHGIQPMGAALQLRLAEQAVAAASGPQERTRHEDRAKFIAGNLTELIYDLVCPRGHSTLRTGPQLIRFMRRTPGRWVSLS